MEIYENKTPRMRTLPMAMKEIKAADPGTQLTLATLRKLVDRGMIGTVPLGNYRLIDLDKLFALLSNGIPDTNVNAPEHVNERRGKAFAD
ncbi:MAG: hypothetical protein IK104_07655 [Clostridia bacterium]|nr:hypothetical protein [Clostridia bacterium]